MPNRQLTAEELETLARPFLDKVRVQLAQLSDGDVALHWALRRKLYKELIYDERGKPMFRGALKVSKWKEQAGLCPLCQYPLPKKGAVLDRLKAMVGYTPGNTRLLCPTCDTAVQTQRGYK